MFIRQTGETILPRPEVPLTFNGAADEVKNHEENNAEAPAPVNHLHFSRLKRLILHILDFFLELGFLFFFSHIHILQ